MNHKEAKSKICSSDLIMIKKIKKQKKKKPKVFEGFWWVVECFSNVRWYYGSDNTKDDKNLETATSVILPESHIEEKKKFNN